MKRPREQDTVAAILEFLHLHKIPAWRMNTGATKIEGRFLRFGVTGMSDIIGVWPRAQLLPIPLEPEGMALRRALTPTPPIGQFICIEVKSGIGKLSVAQQAFLDRVTQAGGKAFVARSVADVQRELGL
jgi:hypothetical protein